MTIYLNVTDAIGTASDHGITRTERKLAAELLGRDGVGFVLAHDRKLWTVAHEVVEQRLSVMTTPRTPSVERFGVDPVPQQPGRSKSVTATARRLRSLARRYREPAVGPRVYRFEPGEGDVLVSAGLDWTHGVLDEAERFVFAGGMRFVGFCYDLIPIDHPEWLFPPDPAGFERHLRRLLRASAKVMCISERTRLDLERHFPGVARERLPVIRLGSDAAVHAAAEHHRFAASIFGDEPYAIYCATIDRRKNHQLLYRSVKELVRRGAPGNIVFVGRTGSGVGDLIDALRYDTSIAGRIAHVTDCDDAHLAALYAGAAFAVYPSLYEGWGLGVTEALAHGKPCLIASGSALSEAGLGVCPELPPLRTRAWVDAMSEYFAEAPTVPELDLPTWSAAAAALIEELRS